MKLKKILSFILSFAMVFCLVPSAIADGETETITLNEEKFVEIFSEGDVVLFEFTCPVDGIYVFSSSSEEDTVGYILDSDHNELAYNDDGGDGNDFAVSYNMTEGEVYYLQAGFYGDGTGTFYVGIIPAPAATELSLSNPGAGAVGELVSIFAAFGPGVCAEEDLTWSCSDEDVAVLLSSGDNYANYQLVGAGTAVVTAVSLNGLTAQTTLTAIAPEELELNSAVSVRVANGSEGYYFFTPEASDGYVFSFTTDAPDCYPLVIVKDEFFNVLFESDVGSYRMSVYLEAGELYNITVLYGSYSGSGEGEIELEVSLPVEATDMEIVPDSDNEVRVGQTRNFTAAFLPWNAAGQSVTWSLSDNDAVEILDSDDRTCILKFNDAGIFTVYASADGGLSASLDVEVFDYDPILPGETRTSSVDGDGGYGYLKFVCDRDGTYEFFSASDYDTYGVLFDTDLNQLSSNDDGGEGSNFSIIFEARAGETYILGVRFYDTGRSGDIPVILDRFASPAAISIERLPKMTFLYEGFERSKFVNLSGLVLGVEFSDGETDLYDFDRMGSYFAGYELEMESCREDDEVVVTLTLNGCRAEFSLPVVPVDVTGITLIRSEEHVLVEFVDGSSQYADDGEGNPVSEFIYYADPAYEQIRIDYADGSSRVASVKDTVKGYPVTSTPLGNTLWEPWDVGDHVVYISYLGFQVSIPYSVVPNRVESIELSGIDHVEFYDHANGYEFDFSDPNGDTFPVFYYFYDYSDFRDLDVIINYVDGTSVTAKPGDVIDGHAVTIDDNQYNDPWDLGAPQVTVAYMDSEAYLPVTIVENPVESINIYQSPRDEYEFGDFRFGSMEGNEYRLDPQALDTDGIGVLVNFKDGTDATLDSSSFNSDFTVTVPGIGRVPYSIEVSDKVDVAGDSVPVYLEIMGKTDSYYVTVNPVAIDSLEIISLPSVTSHYAGYMPLWDGLVLSIRDGSGSSDSFTVSGDNSGYVLDVDYGSVFYFDHNGIRGYITVDPVNDIYTVRYGGLSCEVCGIELLTESPVEYFEVGSFSGDGSGSTVTFHHEDSTSESFLLEDVVDNPDYMISPGLRLFVTITEKGALTYIVFADSATRYRFGFPSLDLYTTICVDPTLYGDLSGDGIIDTVDLTMLRQYLADTSTAVDKAADVDGNGVIDTVDLTLLRQHLADNSVVLGPQN